MSNLHQGTHHHQLLLHILVNIDNNSKRQVCDLRHRYRAYWETFLFRADKSYNYKIDTRAHWHFALCVSSLLKHFFLYVNKWAQLNLGSVIARQCTNDLSCVWLPTWVCVTCKSISAPKGGRGKINIGFRAVSFHLHPISPHSKCRTCEQNTIILLYNNIKGIKFH